MRISNHRAQWHRWFAWHPVRFGPWKKHKDGDLVWWEWVERRVYHIGAWAYCEYRAIGDTTTIFEDR